MSGGGALGTLAGAGLAYATGGASIATGAMLGGAAGSLLGGGGGLTSSNMGQSTNSTTTPNVPSWLLPYLQQNASAANQLAQQPYQPYTGQQVAGLTGLQNQAAGLAAALPGQAQAGFNQANAIQTSVAQQGLNGINPQTIQNYMNPYTTQVMDASQKRQLQQYQLEQNQLEAQQGQTGAFGGSRSALAQGQLASNFEQQLSQNEATQLQNNFTNAENMAMQGMGQANTAAQGIMQGTAGAQQAGIQNIGALQTAGGLEQTTNQNQLNAAYQNYLTAQAYPYQQLQNSQNILNPIASLTTGTNATGFSAQTGNPSTLQTAAGLASIYGGLSNTGLSSGSSGSSNPFSFLGFGNNANTIDTSAATSYTPQDLSGLGTGMLTNQGFMNGGMIPHGMYASGGMVQPPISDSINHFINQYVDHFNKGGMIGCYSSGGQVKSDIPGTPTKYGYTAEETPYTNQSPKYLIPAYAQGGLVGHRDLTALDRKFHNADGVPYTHQAMKRGGQIPLQGGLSDANIAGVKREREHWGKPYVKQDPAAAGYLRPNIKNMLSTGGIAGAAPRFSNNGLTAHYGAPHYDDGGVVDALAPVIGLAQSDADLNAMTSGMTSADAQQPSLVDSMVAKYTDNNTQANDAAPAGLAAVDPNGPNADPMASTFEEKVKALEADPNAPYKKAAQGLGEAAGAAREFLGHPLDIAQSLFQTLTGTDTPGQAPKAAAMDPVAEHDAAIKDPKHIADVKAGQELYDQIGASKTPPSLPGTPDADASQDGRTVDQALGFTPAKSSDKMTSEDVQAMVMKRIMDRQSTGVNLPLLSMGAAILGNRSNSLMGALGAGAGAYASATQEQNKTDLEALQKMTMADFYGRKAASLYSPEQDAANLALKKARTSDYLRKSTAGNNGVKSDEQIFQNAVKDYQEGKVDGQLKMQYSDPVSFARAMVQANKTGISGDTSEGPHGARAYNSATGQYGVWNGTEYVPEGQ